GVRAHWTRVRRDERGSYEPTVLRSKESARPRHVSTWQASVFSSFRAIGNSALADFRSAQNLGLVVEAASLDRASAFLGGELDVARRQEEDLVGDALHAPVERIREPAREVDEPLRELGVGALQVQDHGNLRFEAIGDLLRVVEGARRDE